MSATCREGNLLKCSHLFLSYWRPASGAFSPPLAVLGSLAMPLIEHLDVRNEHQSEVSHGAQWFNFRKIWICRKIEEKIPIKMAICGYPPFLGKPQISFLGSVDVGPSQESTEVISSD